MKKLYLIILIFLTAALSGFARDNGTFSLNIKPGAYFQLGDSKDRFNTIGFTTEVNGDYIFPFSSIFMLRTSVGYTLMQATSGDNLNTIALTTGPGLNIGFSRLNIRLAVTGGYYIGMFNDVTSGNPILKAGADLAFNFNPTFSLEAGATYNHFFAETEALSQGFGVYLGAVIRFGNKRTRSNIEIDNIRINPIFPVFFKYYDENPFGNITLINSENGRIENITVSFYVKQYMDSPKLCIALDELNKGEEIEIPLYALLTDSVMEITEATKVQADIIVEYTYMDREMSNTHTETLRLYDRNAITWDDDRKAASFVTSKDPAV